jgi:mono/diheme cytochrome c family protein
VRRARLAAVAAGAVALAGVVVGCGGSSVDNASTPANSPTVMNTALQTDSTGKTVSAPAAAATPTSGAGGGTSAKGDVAAGKAKFATTCNGCHVQDGMGAGGIGPKLAGLGLSAQRITQQIENPAPPMPANLVTGTDRDNVVAYVLSIQ